MLPTSFFTFPFHYSSHVFPGQYKLEPTPEPSDEEEDSSEEEEEAFGGGKKKKEEEDPAASEILDHFLSELYSFYI